VLQILFIGGAMLLTDRFVNNRPRGLTIGAPAAQRHHHQIYGDFQGRR